MLEVYESPCKNCLLTKDRIVSRQRATGIIESCKKKQSYFICHKATEEGKEIVCHNFYHQLGQHSQLIRIAIRLDCVQFVSMPEHERLISHKEIEEKLNK